MNRLRCYRVGVGLFFIAVFVTRAATSGDTLKILNVVTAPEIEAVFQRTNGWVGADGDYSIAVSPKRTLWFFSDTWIGQLADGARTNVTLINNSIGIQTGSDRRAPVEFFWGRGTNGRPAAFIVPADGKGWFWPLGGMMDARRAQVFLHQIEKVGKGGAFGFRPVGVWLDEIENPIESPLVW